jgi:TonB dependent receptor
MRLRLFLFAPLLFALPLVAQSNVGELRLKITDPSGLAIRTSVELVSEASDYRNTLLTDEGGGLVAKRLPFGVYRVHISQPGFAEYSTSITIQSAIPITQSIQLSLPSVETSIIVHDSDTLIDPNQAGSSNAIGTETIQTRTTSLPGRGLQDLVNSQPGWLYEGNAVLHPRGSEYQTQFVVDGIPLTDNRSPSFGPAIEADDVNSMTIYTAGIPAEYGRKMGGVVEVNTLRDIQPGLHGEAVVSGGSFDTAAAFAAADYGWGHNALGASASGSMTAHYLNPVVPENYTNRGTVGDFAMSFERDFTPKDHLTLSARHELARYQIPNELVQENGAYLPTAENDTACPPVPPDQEPSDCVFIPGGQLQTGANFETMGSASYQHIFSSNAIGSLRGMARDNSNDFYSNPESWPLLATQHNDFKEIYFNGGVAIHHGRQEWKAGVESDAIFLHENTSYVIPDCDNPNDPQCPINLGILDSGATTFAFQGHRPDLEQSAYVQDAIRLGNWSINAGLRWDHYQLLVNQNAVSPRLAVSRYFPSAGLMIHASYDRIFQTPSFENILLASNPAAEAIDTSVPALQLPVQPSHGNYYEWGATKAFLGKLRLDANAFRRAVNNYADDSQILSTGISFPIAFDHAVLYGAEAKLEVQQWGKFSGFASYSYIVGNAWFPVTGGLFLGDAAINPTTGHFPDSQDQRNTVRARVRYQVIPRLWIALGCDYNTGLPFQPDLTPQQYAAEYGQVVVNHLNFSRDRILPYFTQNASAGVDLYRHEKLALRLQADVENLGNTLELIDFGGLFSGNAIGPSRTYALRLQTSF